MISRRNLSSAAIVLAALGASSARGPQGPDALRQARETLEASAQAYQRVTALEDTLIYTVKTPSATLPPKTLEIRLGAGRDVAVKDPLIEAIALDGTLYLTKSDAPGKYVAQPYSGDFAKALGAIVGDQGWPLEPVQIAMRLGKDLEGWLTSLRFKQLGPLEISGYERKTVSGQSIDVIHFTAENGELEADFNSWTHFLSRISLQARPPGASKDVFIQVSGELSPKVLESPKGLITFDTSGKVAVTDVTSLDSKHLPTGQPAPPFELESVAGGKVVLGELRGSVVVLDFWATWCAPCWKTLRETQRLSDWVSHNGPPTRVLAIDSLEEFTTAKETRARAADFFQSQGFTMPALLDLKGEVFRAFGSPGLPSIVIIASDGTIFKYHQGSFPEMLETLKGEIRQASRAGKR